MFTFATLRLFVSVFISAVFCVRIVFVSIFYFDAVFGVCIFGVYICCRFVEFVRSTGRGTPAVNKMFCFFLLFLRILCVNVSVCVCVCIFLTPSPRPVSSSVRGTGRWSCLRRLAGFLFEKLNSRSRAYRRIFFRSFCLRNVGRPLYARPACENVIRGGLTI